VYDIVTDIVYVTVTDAYPSEPVSSTAIVVDRTTTTLPIVAAPVQTYAPVEISTTSTSTSPLPTTPSTSSTPYVAPIPTSTYVAPIVTPSDTSVVSVTSAAESTATPQDTFPATNVADLSATATAAHNAARASNQAGPLTWNNEIAQYAYEGSNCSIWGHNMYVHRSSYKGMTDLTIGMLETKDTARMLP